MQRNWKLAYILANINTRRTFETNDVAIVAFDDERLQKILSGSCNAEKLLNGFIDTMGRKVEPSALIVAEDAVESFWNVQALVSFRNIVAISTIIKGIAGVRPDGNVFAPLFSDFFDFYPVKLSSDDGLLTNTPAIQSYMSKSTKFVGMPAPYLPRLSKMNWNIDTNIYKNMISIWESRYVINNKDDKYSRKLFRSLEMAYHATSAPIKNDSTLFDYGTAISLWVSALETLSHPDNKKVNQESVMNLLERYSWRDKRLRNKWYKVKFGKNKVRKVNLIQRLYNDLYNARNDFLHGNAVKQNKLYPSIRKKISSLPNLAPVIYRTALHVYLNEHIIKRKNYDFGYFQNEWHYEKCLLQGTTDLDFI